MSEELHQFTVYHEYDYDVEWYREWIPVQKKLDEDFWGSIND